MKNYIEEFEKLENELLELNNNFNDAKNNTKEFLENCKKYGIKIVSIGVETDKIKSSQNFSFGAKGSAFADEEFDGWPAIWQGVPEKFSGGCGNEGQKQLKFNANLIEGVYEYKRGVWKMI